MRVFLPLALLALAVLSGCDAASDPCDRLLEDGPSTRIHAPAAGDTIRIGEPFLFRATYETGARADRVRAGMSLEWGLPFETPRVLQEVVLDVREVAAGRFTLEQEVVVDPLPGGVSPSAYDPDGYFVVGAYAEEAFACTRTFPLGRGAVTYSEVTVLD